MRILKYIIVILFFVSLLPKAEALSIEYSTTIGTKGSQILIDYYGIGTRNYYLCSVTTRTCTATKKTTLGTPATLSLKAAVKNEMKDKDADHLTLSPSKNLLAFFIPGTDASPTRSFNVRNIKTGAEYSISNSTSYWDLVDDEGRVFAFSPDSTHLVYLDDTDGTNALYIAPLNALSDATIPSTKLATSAYVVDDFIFSDSSTLYYVGNTKDNPYLWSLYRYNLKTNTDTIVASNVSYADELMKVGSSIVFNQLQAKGYGAALYDTATKKVRQFTVPGISTKADLSGDEVVHIGTQTGVLMAPPDLDPTKSYPLVVWLHGGPYRQSSYGYEVYHSYGIYDSILKLLQKDNVIVLELDYPGSFGFGRDYAQSIKGSVGVSDVASVMNAVAYAQNRFHISSTYLTGNSYGGYLSLASVVEHPNTFTGVMSINGVTDWESLLVAMKTSIFNTQFNGLPNPANQYLYDQASIINKIGNLGNQKIEIIQGQSDTDIAPWQAELLYGKLLTANKNVSIVRYPGEGHVFAGKKTISDLCTQMFNFVGVPVDTQCNN